MPSPAQGSNPALFSVLFATYYDSGGAYYVALPDKCVKLTNGGSSICENHGYKVGVAYDVIVRYKKSVGARVGGDGTLECR